jgi:hypothetical protein
MDNDILHKATIYGLLNHILDTKQISHEEYGVLGTAKYVVRKKLNKYPPSRDITVVLEEFNASLQNFSELEPIPVEIEIAAQLEYEAQHLNLELDAGESILCAIIISRQLNHILTGDKRAITAIEALINTKNISDQMTAKVICLEQIFKWLLHEHDTQLIRTAVCSEKNADRAISNCFSCSSPEVQVESCLQGLESYIANLRALAPTALAPDS